MSWFWTSWYCHSGDPCVGLERGEEIFEQVWVWGVQRMGRRLPGSGHPTTCHFTFGFNVPAWLSWEWALQLLRQMQPVHAFCKCPLIPPGPRFRGRLPQDPLPWLKD